MAICDICGMSVNDSDMKTAKPGRIVSATIKGWVPARLPESFKLAGMQKNMWHAVVDGNKQVDWGLCTSCYYELTNHE